MLATTGRPAHAAVAPGTPECRAPPPSGRGEEQGRPAPASRWPSEHEDPAAGEAAEQVAEDAAPEARRDGRHVKNDRAGGAVREADVQPEQIQVHGAQDQVEDGATAGRV